MNRPDFDKSALIIVARHGNTFGPGEIPRWIGARTDLPLVESGRLQAQALSSLFRAVRLFPAEIICGPLLRTRQFAQIIGDDCAPAVRPRVDGRLAELDYGDWEGLSDAEVEARGDAELQRRWREESIRPENAHWGDDEDLLARESAQLLDDLSRRLAPGAAALCVTSSGRMRYLLRAMPPEFERCKAQHTLGVRTGHLALIIAQAGQLALAGWNLDVPQAAALFRSRLAPFTGAA
ncbi:MAG: histidine phosphatase family protein [Oligoflexia bacterium]|nr:histidine phosphatase family protein [Oligoflexia bacterium]